MIKAPTAREWMSTTTRTLQAGDDMREALRILIGHSFPAIPVVDEEDRVVGLLSEKDCIRTICRWAYERVAGGTVADHMSPLESTVRPDMDLLAVAGEFLTCNFVALPVIEDGKLVGTITRQDVLAGIRDWHRREEKALEHRETHRPDCDRPSTIAEMQRTVASCTLEQLARIFKKR